MSRRPLLIFYYTHTQEFVKASPQSGGALLHIHDFQFPLVHLAQVAPVHDLVHAGHHEQRHQRGVQQSADAHHRHRLHQGGAGVIKHQHASDQAQRGHDRTAGDTGSADGEDAEQGAEEEHGADAGQMAVEDLGDGHAEEHFRMGEAD